MQTKQLVRFVNVAFVLLLFSSTVSPQYERPPVEHQVTIEKDKENPRLGTLKAPLKIENEVEFNVPLKPISVSPKTISFLGQEVTQTEKEEIENEVAALSYEVNTLAQVAQREAGGINDKKHKAAVMWCILNRADLYNCSIMDIITAPCQFAWNPDTAVTTEMVDLAKDVVTRWILEKRGYENIGRVLPKEYLYFTGDGQFNYFRKCYTIYEFWDWSLPSPYND